jgi:hypothetical protein
MDCERPAGGFSKTIMERGLGCRAGGGLTRPWCKREVVLKHVQVPTEVFETSAQIFNKGLINVVEFIGSSEPVKVCSSRSFSNE